VSVLVIRRVQHAWADRAREYRVLVDGQQRALLGNDATVQLPVTPGEHKVRMQIDWCRSRDLTVNIRHGEIVRLECQANSNPLAMLLYITIWRANYIALKTVTS
jgi:hypothetical protein